MTVPYYSQTGEDFLLRQLFGDKPDGFFVEVGCIDGKCFSNTLHFEESGWKGLCVEAHNDYIELLLKNRPNSIIEHAAVGEADKGDATFYANSRGSLSTLDKSRGKDFAKQYGEYFTGFEKQAVPMLTLNTIFKKHDVPQIDFMSLDIEGYEIQAMKGLDLGQFSPTVLVIESENDDHKAELEESLIPAGYTFLACLHRNLFYSKDPAHQGIIGDKVFRGVEVIHTQHPCDDKGDSTSIIEVSTMPKVEEPKKKKSKLEKWANSIKKRLP